MKENKNQDIQKDNDELSKNEKYVRRLYLIDKCLSNHSKPKTWKEINEILSEDNLSMTSRNFTNTRNDIEKLFGLKVKSEKSNINKEHIFFYEEKGASIFSHDIPKEYFDKLSEIIERLKAYGNSSDKEIKEFTDIIGVTNLINVGNKQIVEYEKNYDYQDKATFKSKFDLLYNAIKYKHIVKLHYKTFDNMISALDFHPYYLKQYNGRWFCLGHKENTKYFNEIDVVPIDERILKITYLKDELSKGEKLKNFITKYNKKTWGKEYFKDIIGITRYQHNEKQTIRLQVNDNNTLKHLISKPIHSSLKAFKRVNNSIVELSFNDIFGDKRTEGINNNTQVELTLEVIPNYELERFLISYADTLTVLEPQELRDKISHRLNNAINHYK